MVTVLAALTVNPRPSLGVCVALLLAFSICSPLFVTLAAHCRGFVPNARVGRAIACINLMGLLGVFALQMGTGLIVEGFTVAGGAIRVDGFRLVFAAVAGVLLVCGAYYATARDAPARGP